MQLEIVSHCWNYPRLLKYHLSSLVLYPPRRMQVQVSVFYSPEDRATANVLKECEHRPVENIRWRWRPLEPSRLLRRAIGRNLAARSSTADWLWFADCDLYFGEKCLDDLFTILSTTQDRLLYPQTVQIQRTHALGDAAIERADQGDIPLSINPEEFVPHIHRRAIGGVQIVSGEAARRFGYCPTRRHQRPALRWMPTSEDHVFRVRLGTSGTPVDLANLFRIRHSRRGQDEVGVIL